jgi:hypothetical protein
MGLIDGQVVEDIDLGLESVCKIERVKQVYDIGALEAAANGVTNAVLNRISAKISKKLSVQ